jgi:branched-subunit amino acid aminotransferase/4-amino-4-deoxychorismate lyase
LAEELVAHNAALLASDDDLILVFFATPGPVGYYGGLPGGLGDGPPTLGMHTFPLPFWRYQRLFRKGASLVIPAVRHVAAASVDPRIKQRSRLHWWLADREAQESEPGSIALLLNLAGQVTETAGANFLLVRAGTVVSPPAETILGGISLMAVKELCADLGIAFEERPISAADCHTADEALLASTPYCLAGVRQIDGHPIPWPGTLWQRLLAAWNGRAGHDIAGQILRHR